MKAGEFAQLLRTAASLTGQTRLATVAAAFEAAPSATVASILRGFDVNSRSVWEDRENIVKALGSLRPLLMLVGRAAVLKDVDALVATVERGPVTTTANKAVGTRASKSAAAANPGAVEDYLGELTSTLGDQSRFADVYDRLASDAALSATDLRELAKQFAKVTAKSKGDALKKIWSRHQTLMSFGAKARATDGRSAA